METNKKVAIISIILLVIAVLINNYLGFDYRRQILGIVLSVINIALLLFLRKAVIKNTFITSFVKFSLGLSFIQTCSILYSIREDYIHEIDTLFYTPIFLFLLLVNFLYCTDKKSITLRTKI